MKRIIVAILCLGCLGMCSCFQPAPSDIPFQTTDSVLVTLPIVPCTQDIFTRTTDENNIADVNLYVARDERIIKHVYSTGETLSFICPVGQYKLYIIANNHGDMGEMDYNRMRTYPVYAQKDYEDLPMAAVKDVKIEPTGNVMLSPVEVERIVAKISYDVSVPADVADIEIQSVQAMMLPIVTMPFNEFKNYPNHFSEGPVILNNASKSRMSGEFYMLPNPQGIVPTVNSQADKNALNAPAMATYLRIRALRDNKVLDYSVYLGENATSDFNICANTAHTYHIILLNDNESDVRIRSYTIDARCQTATPLENGIALSLSPITLSLYFSGKTEDMMVSCELEVISGDRERFEFNGTVGSSVYAVPISWDASVNEYVINYNPLDFKRANAVLKYRLNVYDKYGYVTSLDFSFFYAKRIRVFTKWFDSTYGNGYATISSPDAFNIVRSGSLSAVYYLVYCPDDGCTLVAQPVVGRRFIGWYREYNGMGGLGTDAQLAYTPLSTNDELYAYTQ